MRRFFFTLFILGLAYTGFAQVDTEFWFVPPEITSGHGDRPIYLRISTLDQAATVRVFQPARGNVELVNFSIPANTTRTTDLTPQIINLETDIPSAVMKTGIRIVSSAPVTAYYEEASTFNAEIFVLKGKNALGNKFIIPGQNTYNNSSDYKPTPYFSFDIVATQDNTVVKVRPTKPIFGHISDTVITVKLNAGETYSFRKGTQLANDNPVGTVVESNKPIAITLKDDSLINSSCRDLIGDQLIPVKVAGMEYVVLKGFLTTSEYLFITATEDNTDIFIDGSTTPTARLNTGQLYRYQLINKSTYVLANKTIYVIHVTGFGCELGMAVLPAINCKGSEQIGFTRSTNEFFGLNILVRKEGIDHFTLNGSATAVSASQFSPVTGTNDGWYTAQLSFNTAFVPVGQASLITNDQNSFQVGIINGDAMTTCRYGYFSAFSTLFIGDDFTICEGSTATLDAGPGKESYLWSTGSNAQTIDVTNAGQYWVRVEKDQCVLFDTVRVGVKKGEEDLGPDVAICKGDTAKIDGKENFSWHWSNGTTDRFLKTTVLGKYWVSVFDDNGCPASDTIAIGKLIQVFDSGTFIKMNVVSVDTTDENTINMAWAISPATENIKSNKVFLHKKVSGAIDWQPAVILSADVNSFADKGNLTDEEIVEYYVGLANTCSEEQVLSKVHNTIQLTGQADTTTEVITFQWNHYQNWDGGVKQYELWRKLDESPGYVALATVPGNENTFSSALASDGFEHHYLIRAVDASGNNESWSNDLELKFENQVFVPNVFTPNGDVYNEDFTIKKIELYKNSELTVIDRWGKTVFKASNYKNEWNGEGVSSGVYYYVLDLNRNNKILKGTLNILR